MASVACVMYTGDGRLPGERGRGWLSRENPHAEAAAARLGLGRSRVPLRCDLFRSAQASTCACFERPCQRRFEVVSQFEFPPAPEAVIRSRRLNEASAREAD
jgi:hypothetical protein